MTKVIGWAALVGGALSGALAGLLLLGPMLGFYGWDHSGPGARSSGSLALPAALEQARSPATRSPLTAPVGTLTLAGGGTVSAFAPVSPGVSRSATPRLGRLERVGRPVATAPTPATGTPAAPAVPAAPVPVTAPVPEAVAQVPAPAQAVVATPVVAAPVTTQRPTTKSFSDSSSNVAGAEQPAATDGHEDAKAAREAAKVEQEAAKVTRKTAREAAKADVPAVSVPVVADQAVDESSTTTQDDGHAREHGHDQGTDHDQGRGNGHDQHEESQKDGKH